MTIESGTIEPVHRHDEYAFARWHEQHGVDHYDAKAIVSVGERVADRVEICPSARDQAGDSRSQSAGLGA